MSGTKFLSHTEFASLGNMRLSQKGFEGKGCLATGSGTPKTSAPIAFSGYSRDPS